MLIAVLIQLSFAGRNGLVLLMDLQYMTTNTAVANVALRRQRAQLGVYDLRGARPEDRGDLPDLRMRHRF